MKFCIDLVKLFGNMNVKFEYYCCIKNAHNMSKYGTGYAKFRAESMDIPVLCLRSIKLNCHHRSFDEKVILTAIHD